MHSKSTGIWLTIIVNILISLFLIAGVVIMMWNLYHFINKMIGFTHVNEVSKYVKGFSNDIKEGKVDPTKVDLNGLIKALNVNLGDHKIVISPNATPKEVLDQFNNALQKFMHDDAAQHTFFKAFAQLIKDKNETLNSIREINDNHVAFATSLIEFSDYVSIKRISVLVFKGGDHKEEIIKLILKGIWKWFKKTSDWFFIGLVIFVFTWFVALISSIVTKVMRRKRNLNGGGGLIFWAILMPLFGYIFYPLISFSYLLRKKA